MSARSLRIVLDHRREAAYLEAWSPDITAATLISWATGNRRTQSGAPRASLESRQRRPTSSEIEKPALNPSHGDTASKLTSEQQ